jgi:hypothetical protein
MHTQRSDGTSPHDKTILGLYTDGQGPVQLIGSGIKNAKIYKIRK